MSPSLNLLPAEAPAQVCLTATDFDEAASSPTDAPFAEVLAQTAPTLTATVTQPPKTAQLGPAPTLTPPGPLTASELEALASFNFTNLAAPLPPPPAPSLEEPSLCPLPDAPPASPEQTPPAPRFSLPRGRPQPEIATVSMPPSSGYLIEAPRLPTAATASTTEAPVQATPANTPAEPLTPQHFIGHKLSPTPSNRTQKSSQQNLRDLLSSGAPVIEFTPSPQGLQLVPAAAPSPITETSKDAANSSENLPLQSEIISGILRTNPRANQSKTSPSSVRSSQASLSRAASRFLSPSVEVAPAPAPAAAPIAATIAAPLAADLPLTAQITLPPAPAPLPASPLIAPPTFRPHDHPSQAAGYSDSAPTLPSDNSTPATPAPLLPETFSATISLPPTPTHPSLIAPPSLPPEAPVAAPASALTQNIPTDQALAASSASALPQPKDPTSRPTEKFAAKSEPLSSKSKNEVKTPTQLFKNIDLTSPKEELTEHKEKLGTHAANEEATMSARSSILPSAPRPIEAASTDFRLPATASAANNKLASPEAHTTQIVREIRDIADGLWALDRNSVEVRFNFSETENLSVRIEYKDGTVQALFRTDSPSLRDTIAQEWQSQVTTDTHRPYLVTNPVFNASSSDQKNLSSGSDTPRHQHPGEQQQPAPASALPWETASRQRGTSAPSQASPIATRRPDTSVHLSTFA